MKKNGTDPTDAAERTAVEMLMQNLTGKVSEESMLFPKVYGGRFSDRDLEIFLYIASDGSKAWKRNVQIDNACISIEVKSHRKIHFETSSNVAVDLGDKKRYPVEQARQSSQEIKSILVHRSKTNQPKRVFYFACFPNVSTQSLDPEDLDQVQSHCQWPYVLFRDELNIETILVKIRQQYAATKLDTAKPIHSVSHFDSRSFSTGLPQYLSGVKKDIVLGDFDRHRFERISKSKIQIDEYLGALETGDVIIRGKAGSGKSVCAIKLAIDYHSKGLNVLLCTWNVALANDLDMLFKYHRQAEGPKLEFGDQTPARVHINNIDKLIFDFAKTTRHVNGEPSAQAYVDFETGKRDARRSIVQLTADLGPEYVRDLLEVEYDLVIIDEAQDVEREDRAILEQILGRSTRFVYIDSPDQTLRRIEANCVSGTRGSEYIRNTVYRNYRKIAKYAKRLQRQLPAFLRNIDMSVSETDADSSDEVYAELEDGYVEIIDDDMIAVDAVISRLIGESKAAKYDEWATMIIVPGPNEAAKIIARLQANNIVVWDGTNREVRAHDYDPRSVRVIDYRSCRGLEAYNVVVYRPDIAIKRDLVTGANEKQSIVVASNQIFVALSRAINSLTIVVPNVPLKGLFERALQGL